MNIFFVNFLLTLLWAVIFLYSNIWNQTLGYNDKRKIFIIICCIQWILISGLRADFVGADTGNYMRLFDLHNNLSWSELWENVKLYYFSGGVTEDYELGYILFEKIIGSITSSHVIYKFIIATIFMSAFGRFLYKNSLDPFISFIVYDALMYNMFSLTGYRQVVSVSIGILCGYEFVKKRRFIPFLMLILIASLFHKSTLIFILFYFMANIKISNGYLLGTFVTVLVLIVSRNQVFNYIKVLVGYEQYSGNYGFAQQTFMLLLIALTFVAILCKPQVFRCAKNIGETCAEHYYNALALCWFMIPFAMVSPTSMRLVYDFGFVAFLLLIPALVRSFYRRNDRIIVYSFMIVLFGYFVLTGTPEYAFYWQV